MIDFREEMELAVDAARMTLPEGAYGAASYSLHYGPSGGGAGMSWEQALEALRDWAAEINDWVIVGYEYDDEGDEHEVEVGRIDASDIVAGVIGRDLASYL